MSTKLLTGLMCIFIAFSAQAKNNDDRSSIEVIGTASTEVIPDIMNWQLTVENKGKDLKAVAKVHTETVGNLLTILKGFGIAEDKTKTSNMSFGEDWEYRDRSRIKVGYEASTTITFSINDFNQYKSLWLKLSTINAVSVDSVRYDYSKRTEVEDKIRQKALISAISKAKSLVSVLENTTLGAPLSIREGYRPHSYDHDDLEDDGFGFGGSEQSPIAAGIIEITVNITATFRLLSK